MEYLSCLLWSDDILFLSEENGVTKIFKTVVL